MRDDIGLPIDEFDYRQVVERWMVDPDTLDFALDNMRPPGTRPPPAAV